MTMQPRDSARSRAHAIRQYGKHTKTCAQKNDIEALAGGQPTAWDPEGLLGDVTGDTNHLAKTKRAFAEVPTVAPEERGFGAQVEAAFLDVFAGVNAAPRVLDSFQRLCRGEEYVHLWPGKGVQRAGSFMEGLTAEPFPDIEEKGYEWLKDVEHHADVIRKEFQAAMKDPGSMLVVGNKVWAKAAREEAVSYGPNWRTLVLQDRGVWDESNIKLFPKTHKLLLDIQGMHGVDIVLIVYPTNYYHIFLSVAPTLEVFFARQDGKTGIKSHTDNANFIQTTHLGIDVPEGECWIKVGEHTREWMNGKIIICDTSFMHETENESENDRYVLIMRHWHPEVTAIEKIANEFLFAALDNGTDTGLVAAQKHALRKIKGLRSASSSAASNGGGGGFGGGSLKKKPGQKKKRK